LGVTHGKRLKFSGGLPILNGAAMLSRRREWKDEGLCRMKKQICFAGFAERELDALQPALAALGGAWTCVFSPDAAAARAVLLTAPFDAAVVNLRPDGICDSALLQEAATQHPRMLRFVLGEVGDRDLMVNCIGAAHQFISRPWKAPELISIIERSLALDAWLSNDNLRSFVPRLG
jgi:DNA-binding NtrC family response regulator